MAQTSQWLSWLYDEVARPQTQRRHLSEPLALHVLVPSQSTPLPRYWFGQAQPDEETKPVTEPTTDTELDIEPDTVPPPANGALFDLDTFKFVIRQISSVRLLQFSGWGEPLTCMPDLFKMIDYAQRFNGIASTVQSHGDIPKACIPRLLNSKLAMLSINMIAHKPSAYMAISGDHPAHFLHREQKVIRFLEARKRHKNRQLIVELVMTVEMMSIAQIPEMIAYATALGADAIRFDSVLGHTPVERTGTDTVDNTAVEPDRLTQTLYDDYATVQQFLDDLQAKDYSIQVTLPAMLPRDMSGHRHCHDPHHTVSIRPDLRISPCTRHRVFGELEGNIWDQALWQNTDYRRLREIHTPPPKKGRQSRLHANAPAVPPACRYCPKNLPEPPRVLNPRATPMALPKFPKTAAW